MTEQSQGTIIRVLPERAFGFVCVDGVDAFFHISDVPDGLLFNTDLVGRQVTCDIGMSARGPRASNVTIVEQPDE